jgi:hypothetical protein
MFAADLFKEFTIDAEVSFVKLASYQVLECKDYKIELIENYPCKTLKELEIRERYWYDNIENCNYKKPSITKEETKITNKKSYDKHRDEILIRRNTHYANNAEIIKKKRKEDRHNCGCGSSYGLCDRARHFKTQKHLAYISTLSFSTP